jgi:beta-1,2-mannobiose phosphorylase / 1,2-beta-oligomannan phosphorylase
MPHTVKLTRYEGNPILEARPENSWEAQNVANAGAVMHDGKVHILYRAEGFEKREPRVKQWPVTRLGLAVAADGFHVDERPAVPVLGPEPPGSFAEHGVQDPRIALIDGTYYLTLSGVSRWGNRTLLYATENFRTYRKIGDIQPEFDMHSCGLFPARFGGRYAMLLRYLPNLWLAYTRDFKTWEPSRLLFETRKHSWYGQKLGIGATPIRQDDAWLLFWHGKADTLDGTYSLGVMWLDLEDPSKVLRVQEEPILRAERPMEREGYYPNVVYTCGAVELNGQYLVYYGCADRCLAVATVPVADCRL